MKLTHTINMDIDGKKVELEVRDLTKKESKAIQKKNDKLKSLVDDMNKMQKQSRRFESKLERINERIKIEEDSKEKLKMMDERDTIFDKLEAMEDDAEKLDLKNLDENMEALFKERIELACSGEGFNDIIEVAESYGYKRTWEAIMQALDATEKKQ